VSAETAHRHDGHPNGKLRSPFGFDRLDRHGQPRL